MTVTLPTDGHNIEESALKSNRVLRLWPAISILLLQLLALVLTVTPAINNATRFGFMMLGPAVCVLLFAIWLGFFSRLLWRERLAILAGMIAGGILASQVIDTTMGVTMWIYGVPLVMVLTTVTLWIGRRWSPPKRTVTVLAAIVGGWSVFLAGRMDGFDGSYWPELRWRWSESSEITFRATQHPTTLSAMSSQRISKLLQRIGQVFAVRREMAECLIQQSRPTGTRRRRANCGEFPWGRHGPLLQPSVIDCLLRNNAVTAKLSSATTPIRALRFGVMPM